MRKYYPLNKLDKFIYDGTDRKFPFVSGSAFYNIQPIIDNLNLENIENMEYTINKKCSEYKSKLSSHSKLIHGLILLKENVDGVYKRKLLKLKKKNNKLTYTNIEYDLVFDIIIFGINEEECNLVTLNSSNGEILQYSEWIDNKCMIKKRFICIGWENHRVILTINKSDNIQVIASVALINNPKRSFLLSDMWNVRFIYNEKLEKYFVSTFICACNIEKNAFKILTPWSRNPYREHITLILLENKFGLKYMQKNDEYTSYFTITPKELIWIIINFLFEDITF